MNYQQAMEILQSKHIFGKDEISLDGFYKYMEDKGNPQYSLKCIHISGTNGKGSTSCALKNVLMENYRVGCFNSPSLTTPFDAMQVNEQSITQEEYESYIDLYFDEWMEYDLSSFEVDVFVSVLFFLNHKVDFVIYEVGMGGKEDATNIIHSILSCITNIGMDHCDYLGNTYADIALNKAGIIKPNSLFITGETRQECIDIFDMICASNHTQRIDYKMPTNVFVDSQLHFDIGEYKDIWIPTLAIYQAQNISLAIQILETLKSRNVISYTEEQLRHGLSKFSWMGRFEVISEDPLIILDGAHNEEGIHALVQSVQHIDSLHVLFSALKDKPYEHMLEELSTVSKDITVCVFEHYRAANLEDLRLHSNINVIQDYKEMDFKSHTPLLICGSLYFIKEIREYIKKVIE